MLVSILFSQWEPCMLALPLQAALTTPQTRYHRRWKAATNAQLQENQDAVSCDHPCQSYAGVLLKTIHNGKSSVVSKMKLWLYDSFSFLAL